MFEHSTKVPRHYKVAANILKKVSTEGGSLKSLLYDSKLRHYRVNVLYALITCATRNAEALTRIFLDCQIFEKEPRLDPWLARILAVEILMGKKSLPGHSKPEQTLLQYNEQIQSYACKHPEFFDSRGPRRPRYVRVNTIELAIEDFISSFEYEGYRFIPCTTGSYNDYLVQVQKLEEGDFLQDYHVKAMFAFHADTKFYDHQWVLEGKILLQDKATSMSVHLLAPEQMSVILDMCAAPGMKTTQLAAAIQCKGLIYAVERNVQRYKTLVEFINKTNSYCVEPLNLDAFDLRQNTMDKVEYILLDPSCSGSGMDHHVHSYGDDDQRLESLTSLQEKLLKHAMNSFPNAKRIVYSTCSLLPEENERVVKNVIKNSRSKWQVQDVKDLLKGQWNNFGAGLPGSLASKCLYAKPESDFTTGFFLAVMDRKKKDLIKTNRPTEIESVHDMETESEIAEPIKNSKKSNKHKAANGISEAEEMQVEGVSESGNQEGKNDVEKKSKSKKKRKLDDDDELLRSITNNLNDLLMGEEIPEKKRKTDDQSEVTKKKNKKKRKKIIDENELTKEIVTETESTSHKKKSKKNVEVKEVTDENQTECKYESRKKKRKKNVEINEVTEGILIESELATKKKKSKKNVESNELIDEIQVECESAPKKKKHNRNLEVIELPEVIQTESDSKKKKRRKNVEVNELTEET